MSGDFILSANRTLTIATGETASAGTVTISAVNNSVDAPNKTVTVSGSASGGGVSNPSSKTLTITDNDSTPTVTLVLSPSSISESGGSSTVTADTVQAFERDGDGDGLCESGESGGVGRFQPVNEQDAVDCGGPPPPAPARVTITAVDNSVFAANKLVDGLGDGERWRGVESFERDDDHCR